MTTLDVPTKPWYTSKTIWTSVLSVILLILGSPEVTGWIADHPQAAIWIGLVIQILQTIWRYLADRPIAFSSKTQTRALKIE